VEYEAKQKNGFWPWGSNFRDNWDPTMDRGHRLSTESLTEIRHIWESGDTEDYIKETAFSFWVKAIDDIDTLNLILPENKYFKMALRRRILLRDISIVPYIKPLVASDSHILRSIYRVWSSEFISEVEKYLFKLDNQTPIDYSGGCSNEHYDLSHLLRDIPIEDSEKLLLKHWDCLKYSYLFLQLALYIGTEKCKYLADSAIKMCPKTIDPFTHISFFFGFRVQDLAERVNMGHLNTLLPYIEKLDDHTIIDMVEYCFQKDYIFWAERYLHPEFDRRRSLIKNNQCNDKDYIERMGKEYFPTEQDLYEKLDWIEQQDKFKISYWTKDFVERNHSLITWQNILENWFIKAPSSSRFEVAQSMISQHGKRSDLALLFRCSRYIDELLCSKQLLEQAKFNVMRRNLI
jgi:hypothetical protein